MLKQLRLRHKKCKKTCKTIFLEDKSPTLSRVKLVRRFVKQLGQPTQLVQHLHGDMTGNVLMAV